MRGGSGDLAEKIASADPAALLPGRVAQADPTAPGPVRLLDALDLGRARWLLVLAARDRSRWTDPTSRSWESGRWCPATLGNAGCGYADGPDRALAALLDDV